MDIKEKNGLKSYTEAADKMAEYILSRKDKKKLKEKVIREIEF